LGTTVPCPLTVFFFGAPQAYRERLEKIKEFVTVYRRITDKLSGSSADVEFAIMGKIVHPKNQAEKIMEVYYARSFLVFLFGAVGTKQTIAE
jgi:hypothetical protein